MERRRLSENVGVDTNAFACANGQLLLSMLHLGDACIYVYACVYLYSCAQEKDPTCAFKDDNEPSAPNSSRAFHDLKGFLVCTKRAVNFTLF